MKMTMDSWEQGIKIRFLERRIAELEEADRFGMQNRQLVSDNLELRRQLAEKDKEIERLRARLLDTSEDQEASEYTQEGWVDESFQDSVTAD